MKPRCPFCGRKIRVVWEFHGWSAYCDRCVMDMGHYDTKQEIVDALSGKKEPSLKPCPLCGNKVEMSEFEFEDGKPSYLVNCKFCRMDVGFFSSKKRAIKTWNKRKR